MLEKRIIGAVLGSVLAASAALSADWPMWRHDAGRTAATPQAIPENHGLRWVRHLPPLKPAFRDNRLQFDGGYEPIVLGKRLFFGSSRDDSVTALDTETGEPLWKFFTDGPVRFAPVGGKGRIIFGSDDGCVYCLKASDGSLVWKKRAVPSYRRVLGNGRLISVWPIRGGPVLKDQRVYFAAGVWPLEGTFVFCVDAATGETIWRNDRAAYLYGIHPHNAEAYGGLAPQGYLVIDNEAGDLVVPNSQAYPARFDLNTGELKDFELPAAGRLPGGWFASTPSDQEAQKLKRRGVLFDKAVNYRVHEDKPHFKGDKGVRDRIFMAGAEWKFDNGFSEVTDPIHSAVAADGKLFTVTKGGALSCYSENPDGSTEHGGIDINEGPSPAPGILSELDLKHGFAVLLGTGDSTETLESLFRHTELRIIAIDDRPDRVRTLRQHGWINVEYGERLTILEDDPASPALPPYFASLIVIDESVKVRELPKFGSPELSLKTEGIGPPQLRALCEVLRPYGGKLIAPPGVELPIKPNLYNQIQSDPEKLAPTEFDLISGVRPIEHESGWKILTREGALPGSTNYTGDWAESADELVTGPMGILWFDDALSHFKRSPQPKFIDGVMISTPKDWTDASTRQGKVDYRLLPPVFSDVYTGRLLKEDEAPELRQSFGEADLKTIQPSQYRPPRQKDDWKPEAPRAGERINPMTLEKEPRVFPKSYGCDGGVDYGNVFSMRSGTPAFYDKRIESGTVNISGPRSGCTNSVIPANGLLNLPYFYDGCTCSYPLPMAVALVSMPESFEQWASWGEVPAEKLSGKIQRLGLNFGAPGDRMTEEGTLWLDVPNVGGPSPAIEVTTEPPLEELATWYRHSLFLRSGDGWPWVAGSGIREVRSVTIGGVKPGKYTVRLTRVAKKSISVDHGMHFRNPPFSNSKIEERGIRVAENGILKIDLKPDEDGEINLAGIEIVRD